VHEYLGIDHTELNRERQLAGEGAEESIGGSSQVEEVA